MAKVNNDNSHDHYQIYSVYRVQTISQTNWK